MGFSDPSFRDWRYRSAAYRTGMALLSIVLPACSLEGSEPRSYTRTTSFSAAVQSIVSSEAKVRLARGFPLTIFVSLARYPRHQIGHSQVSAFWSLFVAGRQVWVLNRFGGCDRAPCCRLL